MPGICQHYQLGCCSLGGACKFAHPREACQNELLQRGSCTRRDTCTYSHNENDLRRARLVSPGSPSHFNTTAHPSGTEVCRKFQQGLCQFGKNCRRAHPDLPCLRELNSPNSCPEGLNCASSHNPLVLEANRPVGRSGWQPGKRNSCVANGSRVCHNYQAGQCNFGISCMNYHPTKACEMELKEPKSCPHKRNCSFAHNPNILKANQILPLAQQAGIRRADKTFKMKAFNFFCLRAATRAQLVQKNIKGATHLSTLDELRGQAISSGVKLIVGSYDTRRLPRSAEEAEPNSIRLQGPVDKVEELLKILQEQERILNGMEKHEARWMFADDPWADDLWKRYRKQFEKILSNEANKVTAWWEFVFKDDGMDHPVEFILASTKVNQVKLQVRCTTNVVNSATDALIISCDEHMSMEEGIAEGIREWYSSEKESLGSAKQIKYGNSPLLECELVPVEPPAPSGGRQRPLILCSHIPSAAIDGMLDNCGKLRQAMRNALQYVKNRNEAADPTKQLRSIAVPLLGTGFGYNPIDAAKAIMEEMCWASSCGIERVWFLDQRLSSLDDLKTALRQTAQESNVTCEQHDLPVTYVDNQEWYYFVGKTERDSSQNHDLAMKDAGHARRWIPDGDGTWFPFSQSIQGQLESAYQQCISPGTCLASPPTRVFSFNMKNLKYPNGINYKIGLDSLQMKQKNTKTGFERRVVRKSSRHQVPDLEVIKEISGYNNGREVLGISYMALDCASSQKACKSVKSEISAGSWGGEKLESFCIPLPDHALSSDEEVQMREILSTFKVSFDIRTFGGQSSSIYLSGLSKEMDRAKDAIVKHPLYQANSFYTFPDNWTSTDPSHNALVDVATGSEEFHAVAAKFVGDLPSAIVERVQRVENVLLYKSYQGNLQILHERYSVNGQHILTNEQLIKKLWHGTSQTDPEVVVLSSYGTEKCHSSPSCLWGQGNYFSTTSAYVDRGYAHRSNGLKKMVLFEVITGLACDMNQDRSLLKPPPVPADHWVREKFGEANAPPNLSFDSVTGVTCETRVYITYSTGVAQQYPLYIVSYKTP